MARFAAVLLCGFGLLGACSGEGPNDLRWDINFACPSDAELTARVHIRVLKGGCTGTDSVYEASLSRGAEAPEDVIPEGLYGLEVRAFDAADALVAEACNAQKLPTKHVAISLASLACQQLGDASAPAVPDASLPEDVCAGGACAPACAVADPGDCSCVVFERHSYLFCSEARSWSDARKQCRSMGTDLVVVNSAEENAFLRLHTNGMSRWMGANDRGNDGTGTAFGPMCDETCKKPSFGDAQEGTWRWVNALSGDDRGAALCELESNQNPVCITSEGAYMNWAPGEPNNTNTDKCQVIGTSCGEGEDCGVFSSDGTWLDNVCSARLPFICETF